MSRPRILLTSGSLMFLSIALGLACSGGDHVGSAPTSLTQVEAGNETSGPSSTQQSSDPTEVPSLTVESPTPVRSPTPERAGASFSFTAGGDHGATIRSSESFALIEALNPDFHLALGDLGYSDRVPESAWCDYVTSFLGQSFPFQVVVGNHEDDDLEDGHIRDFSTCLPDKLASTGDYGVEYYFDFPVSDPLARFILIAADNKVDGNDYQYCSDGDAGHKRCNWLEVTIQEAKNAGLWVVVGMHKPPCITTGDKPCEVGQGLLDLLLAQRVDLILTGHEHDYQRSKQLACAEANRYLERCIVDETGDAEFAAGRGTIIVINGLFGGGGTTEISRDDPENAYFAAWLGENPDSENVPPGPLGRGLSYFVVTAGSIEGQFMGSSTSYEDQFRIVRSTE